MLRMCVYMHSRFVENHPIRILEDGPLIFEVVLSHAASPAHTTTSTAHAAASSAHTTTSTAHAAASSTHVTTF
jgi:hypothetical protein